MKQKLTTVARLSRLARCMKGLLYALVNRHHPILVHLIPIRRCNLACAYCNEYDAVSRPVPLDVMLRRVDHLAGLRTTVVTLSGGEPLLHPQLEAIVVGIRAHGMFATLITNGYLLTPERIRRLNEAGLDHLQLSIDNVQPDDVSKKSLRLLEPKLRWLAQEAEFSVAVNSVLGSGVRNPEDALTIAVRARELGLGTSLGIIHDGLGQLRPLGAREMDVYQRVKAVGRRRGLLRLNPLFQDNLAHGRPNNWRCRAGARYLYVDEDGLVHYCSQQRGYPGIPLQSYTATDVRREYARAKACAPYCTVNCAQQVAVLDNWRSPQHGAPAARISPATVLATINISKEEGP